MTTYIADAEQFLKDTGTKFEAEYLTHENYFDDDEQPRDIYKITLKRNGKRFSFKFGQSIANRGEEPRAYDVLACLTKNDPGTFEDFCGEFGYSTDSRKAEKTYKAVVKEFAGVQRLFGDVIERLAEIN